MGRGGGSAEDPTSTGHGAPSPLPSQRAPRRHPPGGSPCPGVTGRPRRGCARRGRQPLRWRGHPAARHTTRRGAPVNYSYCCGYFWLRCCRRVFFFFSLCSSAGLRRQRAVTCPGTGAAGWARRRLDALGGGRRERGDTFPRRRFNNRSFKARFIRARQKARQISGPRNSTDGAIFP